MFGFTKKMFIAAIGNRNYCIKCENWLSLKCVSMTDQECKVRPAIMNIISNETLFYPCSVLVNKFSGSCNDINNIYTKLCLPDVVKDLNIKVFNLLSQTNETRYVSWHETCACKCRLDFSVCHGWQRWNSDKWRCECKGLIDKERCDNGFVWNAACVSVNLINHVILWILGLCEL